MKTISAGLNTHLGLEVTTVCHCLKVTRTDSTVIGFTDLDENLEVDGVTYYAATGGFASSAISAASDLSLPSIEVNGFLDSDAITDADLMGGLYNYANFILFLVNYEDLTQEELILVSGKFGTVKFRGGEFSMEMCGKTQLFQQTIGEYFSPDCRNNLGDSNCGVYLPDYTVNGVVSDVDSDQPRRRFMDYSRTEADGYFTYGQLTWTGGDNSGYSMEVRYYSLESLGGEFILFDKMPFDIQPTDTFTVHKGCDKSRSMCLDDFDNLPNLRGEPYLPGLNQILKYPDSND